MPDRQSVEERDLIDAALADGRARRYPAGLSLTGVTFVWDGDKLVNAYGARGKAKPCRTAQYTACAAYLAAGYSVFQIADALKLPITETRYIIHAVRDRRKRFKLGR